MTISQQSGDFEHELPDNIKSALRDRYGPVPGVSSEIDKAILADARQQLSARIQPARRRRRWSPWQWTALASTIAAASLMFLAWRPQQPSQQLSDSVAVRSPAAAKTAMGNTAMENTAISRTVDRNDVDQNGRVDILDAFAMARQIRNGDPRARDVNQDGRRDQLDVDLVAREAVML